MYVVVSCCVCCVVTHCVPVYCPSLLVVVCSLSYHVCVLACPRVLMSRMFVRYVIDVVCT